MADLAGHVDIRQEVHLDLDNAVSSAGLASASLDVEGKSALAVTLGLGVGSAREQRADHVKDACISRRIGPWSPSDRRLVDGDDLVQVLESVDPVVVTRDSPGAIKRFGQMLVKDLVDQRALARTRNSGDNRHDPQRDLHVDILEVVDARAAHLDPAGRLSAVFRHRNSLLSAQVLACDGLGNRHDLLRGALRHYFAPVGARARADIHDVVRRQHGVLVVFHHDDRVPQIPQVLESPQELVVVSLVKAYTRLVQNIAHPDQPRSDLGREPDSLGFSA